ncbi:cerberus isoform X2 [Rhineura floridana]|uniref:cerberus isoform X2 n=1 Tax=Rhineura floridana TaxID=261503 RepID=UPI002AC83076|nr:cerberus isoform X2 [Rhineura floridana]
MFFLLLQLLLISWLGATEQREELQKRRRRRRILQLLPQDRNILLKYLMGYEGTLTETSLFMTHLLAELESKRQDEPKMSKFILPYIDSHAVQDLGNNTSRSASPHSGSTKSPASHPHRKREAELPFKKDAKKFWDLFMLKTRSRSEEVVLPIKTNEMHQESCSTIPFSQSIVHENCEKVVVQNNLCFGRCSSFHVPGPEDRLYTFCSHCLPTKFSMKHLEMNCTRSAPVIKVIMMVEECKCEVQKTKDPEIGFLHSDLHANVYEHN